MKDVIARQEVKALKELFAVLRKADQTAMQAAFSAAKEAVLKAEAASEKRFEGVNEFRKTLSDQAGTFATKAETEAKFNNINETLKRLESQDSTTAGRSSGVSQLLGFVIGAGGVLTAIAVAVLK